jgi:uncharacterized protein (DUF952 family)
MIIYHVVLPEVWEHFRTRPSYQAESLQTEGFIHCSYQDQLDAVLDRYYKNAGRVLVLHIETDKLKSKLVEEPSTGGEMYPHLYGRLNHNAVVKVEERMVS